MGTFGIYVHRMGGGRDGSREVVHLSGSSGVMKRTDLSGKDELWVNTRTAKRYD